MSPRARRLRRRDDAGAVAVTTILVLSTVLMAVAAFAVDLGMQRVARRDMQALADVVALDLARLLDGRTADKIRAGDDDNPSLSSALTAAVDRNDGHTIGGDADCGGSCVTPYLVDLDDKGDYTTGSDGLPVEVAADKAPDGVVVMARTEVDFVFGLAAGGEANRRAVATASSSACFRLGSFAAALDTDDSELADVFESMFSDAFGVQMTAIGYEGVLKSYVELDAIAAEMGVGSVEALVNKGNVSVADFLAATARALDSDGQTDAAAVVAELAAKVSADLRMDIGEILSTGNGSAVRGSVNTLDLIGAVGLSAATEIANQNNFLDTGVVWADPWLSKGDVKLTVIEPPQQGCGPIGTTAHTAQVVLDTKLGLELSGEKIEGLALSTIDGANKSTIQVLAKLAGAVGTLSGMTCGAGTVDDPEEIRVRVDSQAVSVDVSVPFHMSGQISTDGILSAAKVASLAGVAASSVVSATLTLELDVTAKISKSSAAKTATGETEYAVPPHDYTDPEPSFDDGDPISIPSVRTADITATATPKLKVKLLGGLASVEVNVGLSELDLTSLTNTILYGTNRVGTSLTNVTTNVNKALVPVSELLGVRFGGADLFGVPRPECGTPSLVG